MQIAITSAVKVELIPIAAGEFVMGSDNQYFSETPAHSVRFGSGFLLGKYPITQAEWQAVMEDNPSAFGDAPDQPVDGVSWDQATLFCQRISDRSGNTVRLPSEAEWEYACRSGASGDFFF